ncbi:MAG: PHP domain-containing protein [Nanoarchaeota archaeon]|nr:PHP domain-containing protein [Nanoarchaeota archaeon]
MLKIDLHIHSILSGHAYGTIYEIMKYAKSKGFEMIAITDHGPGGSALTSRSHFMMGSRAPKDYEGMRVLWGCEANIIDGDGNIDLDEFAIKQVNFLIVGLHTETVYKDLGKDKNTEAIIKCFNKYPIHCFSHPATLYYDYDVEKACQAACDNDILLEINLTNLVRLERGSRKMNVDNFKKIVDVAKKNNKKILVNSDAHFLHEIGDDTVLGRFRDKLGLDDSMIINNFPEELNEFIKKKNDQKV